MPRRSKPVLKIISINLAILALGLLLIELIWGSWFGGNQIYRLNVVKNRSFRYDVNHLYRSEEVVVYSRDAYGLRGNHHNPGDIDLITLGGSTTDQRYIDDQKTWQSVMMKHLESKGKSLQVANAGIDGQSSFGHLKCFEWWFPHVPDLKPSYVLFYIGLNDLYKDEDYAFDALIHEEEGFQNFVKERSILYYMARTLNGLWRAQSVVKISHRTFDFSKAIWTQEPHFKGSYEDLIKSRLKAYEGRLGRLIDEVETLGAKAVIVSQPARRYRFDLGYLEGEESLEPQGQVQINGLDFYHLLRRLDQVSKRVADERGAIFIDLGSTRDWVDEDFYDTVHMKPSGAQKVGMFIGEGLLPFL